jgi:CRISPR/Cas system-associated exonuclease Cas4 (RecB family)
MHADGTCTVEEEWAFTSDLQQTEWLAPDCWLRVKCDVVVHHDDGALTIEDLKTGKRWGNEVKHLHQGQLYAFAGFVRYPSVTDILVVFRYPDQKHQVIEKHYDRDKAFQQVIKHIQSGTEMTTAREFPPKPNAQNCKFCDYGSLNGTGECPFAVEPL